MYLEGEVPYVTGNGYNNNSGFGNGWEGLIGLAIIAALFSGNGFGFGGNRGGNCATQADLAAGFNNSAVLSNLNDIVLGQAQMQNFINQGFAGTNTTITNGFANLNTALCTLGYNVQGGFNSISREIADCCCKTQGNIDSLRYDISKGFCEVIRSGQDNTRAILDYLTNEKIEGLRAENVALKGQISNDRQSGYIINTLTDRLGTKCPEPAYIVPNPNCCYNYNVTGFGYGNVNTGCSGFGIQ